MRPSAVIAAALAGSVLFAAGCHARPAAPAEDEAVIQKSLAAKPTVDLMAEVAKAPDYKPPADGRLTEAQLDLYLAVRQREQRIREVALQELRGTGGEAGLVDALKASGDLADLSTADLRAAVELGYAPKEYQWVKERVLEAQMLAATRALEQQVASSRQQLQAQLERQAAETADPSRRQDLERQIAEIERDSEALAVSADPARQALEANADLIAGHRDQLSRLQAEEQRISQELQPTTPAQPAGSGTTPSGDR